MGIDIDTIYDIYDFYKGLIQGQYNKILRSVETKLRQMLSKLPADVFISESGYLNIKIDFKSKLAYSSISMTQTIDSALNYLHSVSKCYEDDMKALNDWMDSSIKSITKGDTPPDIPMFRIMDIREWR